jgi:hypothetical protein
VTYGAENVYVQMLHEALAPEGIHVNQTSSSVRSARASSTSRQQWPNISGNATFTTTSR